MRYTAYSGTGSPEEILDIYFLINEEIFNELIDGDTTNQSRNLLLKRGNTIYRLSYSKWGRKYKIRKI